MIESALSRCSTDWKEQNADMNKKLDLMLELQKQRLLLDQERLNFERQMAGLAKEKTKDTLVESKTTKSRKRKKGKSNSLINKVT